MIHFMSLNAQEADTVFLKRNQSLVLSDSVFSPGTDTVLYLSDSIDYFIVAKKYSASHRFLNSFREKAFNSPITKKLYKYLFAEEVTPSDSLVRREKSEAYFEPFEGNTIQSIHFIKVDVLEGDVFDTLRFASTDLGQFIQKIHVNTTDNVIEKQLLFGQGDPVDPYILADSERNIRSLPYIQDAKIYLKPDSLNPSFVQAVIVVRDRFSWVLDFEGNPTNEFKMIAGNGNFLGSGHEFNLLYLQNVDASPVVGYAAEATIRNIMRSRINTTFFYGNNYLFEGGGFVISRPFISPEVRYIGEFAYSNTFRNQDIIYGDSLYSDIGVDSRVIDTWVSRGIDLGDRILLNVSLRYLTSTFFQRPTVKLDSNEVFHNRKTRLGGIFYSKINYYKAKNILAFNISEDVPVGYTVSFISGQDESEFETRYYAGVQAAVGHYHPYGYISANLAAGRFIAAKDVFNEVLEFSGNYFSPLIPIGKVQSRIFLRSYFFTSDELSIPITANLSNDNRVRNVQGTGIAGNKIYSGTLESVFFLPRTRSGYGFAPYAFSDYGVAKENRTADSFKKRFQTVGAGIRIKNESFVFEMVELRFAYFLKNGGMDNRLTFNVSISAPVFFGQINDKKPRLVGVD